MRLPYCRRFVPYVLFISWFGSVVWTTAEQALAQSKQKSVAGKADVLRQVPKKIATLLAIDSDNHRVKLMVEGEGQAREWQVLDDADLKIHGWWGRLQQFNVDDRVWVWFAIDRNKEPKGVLMLADEISEQSIHGLPHKLIAFDEQTQTATIASDVSGQRKLTVSTLNAATLVGEQVYVQAAGESARTLASLDDFAALRSRQREWLRDRWQQDGLPGFVSFLHPLSGEMEVVLDHEAIRWGRNLKNGDKVRLQMETPVPAVVKHVRPWRERTLVRLVTASGVDQLDLSLGQRIHMTVPPPPAELQRSDLPMDIGRRTAKRDRIEWFLASTYCSCKIAGDRCTGMFYSLASCNENSCAMPNRIRATLAKLVDEGLTDEQIWQELIDMRGPNVGKQHLLR